MSRFPGLNLLQVGGQKLTPRDWSLDFEKLQNIDIPLSSVQRTRVYEQGFEEGESDLIASGCTQTVQSMEVYAGSYALQVTVPAGSTGYVETPTRPVSPGQRVTFGFAHKEDENVEDVKLIVVWYRASGGIIDAEEYALTPSTEWQVDARTVVAPAHAAYMALRMQATAKAGADGNVYLDEMTIDLVGQILRTDGRGRVLINLDEDSVGLAKEATLSALSDKFPDKVALADNLANPTTTVSGVALRGFDGNHWMRLRVASDGKLLAQLG
ncbi:MAG: hypothetical protein DRO12_05945 [Thermoprotei archaeon]|nr:MAG: hypothetical protein DRO12_05945 [Thermoprotei archaeon]